MIVKRIARALLIFLASLIILAIIFVAVSVSPIDRTPVQEMPVYSRMLRQLDSLEHAPVAETQDFLIGFNKLNFTPAFPTATAGYGKRRGKQYSSVHDSIYVRTLVIANGASKVAIVTADLLIIPPTVTAVLKTRLPEIGFSLNNTYLGATHSHNSIGNWGAGLTRFLYGSYEDSVVNFIADAILNSIRSASANMIPGTLKAGRIPMPEAVENRMIDGGPEDSFFRVLEVRRSDSTKLLLTSFTAHATCLYSRDLELSRDYPGKLVDMLEEKGYDFAMFMAGAVGSHGCSPPKYGWDCIDWMAEDLSAHFLQQRDQLTDVTGYRLMMQRTPLQLPEPQVKILEGWKIRPWLFRFALGEYPADLTVLRIGDLVMLGTPCDFSGEFDAPLDSVAAKFNSNVIVTSFNGGYIGYVTPARYYDVDHYETRLMNWYSPGNGEYISSCLQKMIVTAMED
jgi:neutral ceramidase